MKRDNLARDGEAQSQAREMPPIVDPMEAREDRLALIGWETHTLIGDGEKNLTDEITPQCHRHDPICGAVLDRVVEQVGDDLLEADRIDLGDKRRWGVDNEGMPVAVAVWREGGVGEDHQISRQRLDPQLARLDLADVEQARDKLGNLSVCRSITPSAVSSRSGVIGRPRRASRSSNWA